MSNRRAELIGDVPAGLLSPLQEGALKAAATTLLDQFFADVGHLEAGGDFEYVRLNNKTHEFTDDAEKQKYIVQRWESS